MVYLYKNTKISYQILGEGESLIVLLHGWGGDSQLMFPLYNKFFELNSRFRFLLIDFPPFGESEEPLEPWVLTDYVNIVENLIKNVNIDKMYIIGHSFGGRVAIRIAAEKRVVVDKLVLLASAGIKPRYSCNTKYKIIKYKVFKKIGLETDKLGSKDYKSLSPIMRKTFINIVNEDLTKISKSILCKTLLVFGDKDKETPLYMGKLLHKKIKNSDLIILKNAGHFAYIDSLNDIFPLINTFLYLN